MPISLPLIYLELISILQVAGKSSIFWVQGWWLQRSNHLRFHQWLQAQGREPLFLYDSQPIDSLFFRRIPCWFGWFPFKKKILWLGNKGDCDSPPLFVLYQSKRGACHLAKICFAARVLTSFLRVYQRLTICSQQEPLVKDVDLEL